MDSEGESSSSDTSKIKTNKFGLKSTNSYATMAAALSSYRDDVFVPKYVENVHGHSWVLEPPKSVKKQTSERPLLLPSTSSYPKEELQNYEEEEYRVEKKLERQKSGRTYEELEELVNKYEQQDRELKQKEPVLLKEEKLEPTIKPLDPNVKVAKTEVEDVVLNDDDFLHNINDDQPSISETKTHHIPDIDADTYELEKFRKNAMIIFNHKKFSDGRVRDGTDLDVEALKRTFGKYRFQIKTCDDRTRKQLFWELEQFSQQDFRNFGCICVAILTHGDDLGYLEAYNTRYNEREVFACFNALFNPTLVAKPIIFLIQACRGDDLARSVPVDPNMEPIVELDSSNKKEKTFFLPTDCDIIIFHSCFFGRGSARVPGVGTWFIQTVCNQIELYAATEHLEKINRRVRRIIATRMEYNYGKQMPVASSTLIRKLYLKEGNADSDTFDKRKNPRSLSETYRDSVQNMDERTKHVIIGFVIVAVYCFVSLFPFVRQHVNYLIFSLVFFFLGRFDLSWSKAFLILVAFVIIIFFIDYV